MSMRIKFILIGMLPVLVLWIMGIFTLSNIKDIDSFTDELIDSYIKAIELAGEIKAHVLNIRYDVAAYLQSGAESDRNLMKDHITILEETMKNLSTLAMETHEKKLGELTRYVDELKNWIVEVEKGGITADLKEKIGEIVNRILKTADEIQDITKKDIVKSEDKLTRKIDLSYALQLYAPLIILLASAGIVLLFSRVIFSQLGALMNAAWKMKEDDLTFEFKTEYKGKDEISRLLESFRIATRHLKENIGIVKGNASKISEEMDVITSSMKDVAGRLDDITDAVANISSKMEGISANIQEVTAGAEEISAATKSVADNAQEAAEFSSRSAELAREGGQIIREVIDNIKDISDIVREIHDVVENFNKGAKQIKDFVDTITAIAEQTNLLALNAAIEAARAGESGKGFAVVADEIRKLAEESRKAAEEISTVVSSIDEVATNAVSVSERIQNKVEEGSKRADTAGERLGEIIDRINRVTSMMENVAAAVEEQTAAVDEISQAMTTSSQSVTSVTESLEEISTSMEDINASAQEVSSAVERVGHEVQSLREVVAKYRV